MGEQSIGGYRIVGELGRGAMGIVYHAFDPAIGRPVAVKVIRLASDMTVEDRAQLRQRLIREASAAGKLSHPNLVTVYQLGEEGEDVFIAMEFVKGSSLRQMITRDVGMPRERCLEILRQIADGLDYAHRAGVVHRDIKPDNILIREDGCAKVADFGIAKIIESSTQHMTQVGASVGSPSYMSPEQVKAGQLDAKSDQFSLAVVAFEMLTGGKLFAADTMVALMHQIIAVDPLSPPEVQAKLPASMLPALQRALSKNPADRFPTCAEFVRGLAAAPLDESTTATLYVKPPPPPRVAAKSAPLLLIAGVVALLVILAGAWYWAKHRAPAGSAATASPAESTESPLVKAVAENRLADARTLLAHGTDVNAANRDGTTSLMIASEGTGSLQNSIPAIQMLLEKNPNLEAEDSQGRTALYRAVTEGKDDNIAVLLAHKADPGHRATNGSTPLMAAVTYGRMPAMRALLAAGADVNIADNEGKTPLHRAAEGSGYMPNNAPFVQFLLEKGAKIDAQDKQGRSALLLASTEGKTDAVSLLLDQKADPNQKDNNGASPLQMAVTYGKTDVVKILLSKGALVNSTDSSSNTPLMIAAEGNAYLPNNGPLVELLLQSGAKVEPQDSRGRTAFYRAAEDGKEDAMRLLLDRKAELNGKANDGTTPLIAAMATGKMNAINFLIDRGADVNLADANGRTPLMVVADGSPYITNPGDVAKLLLSKGAKKDAMDTLGRTALTRATQAKNNAVADLLK
jgi:ankyrin repeat protein